MKFKLSKKETNTYISIFHTSPILNLEIGLDGDEFTFEVDDDSVRDFQFIIRGHKQDNFTTMLLKLIMKAHGNNWNKLCNVYPAECMMVWAYQNLNDFHEQLEL